MPTPSINYFCPESAGFSGGVRRLYRHVAILARSGLPAFIMHSQDGFMVNGTPLDVPVRYVKSGQLSPGNIVVIPEIFPDIMAGMAKFPLRRFAIPLNWAHIYDSMDSGVDWRDYGIERVLAVCPFIAESVSWAMGLPVHLPRGWPSLDITTSRNFLSRHRRKSRPSCG